MEFYNIIGNIDKRFYKTNCSGNIFTLKNKYLQLCTISMTIRIQGHNPSQIGKWEENSEFRNNTEYLVSIRILIGLLISSNVFSSCLVQNQYKAVITLWGL